MDKHRFALGINTCGDVTLEALDTIAEAGFTHVYCDHLNWAAPEQDGAAGVLAARPWVVAHGVHLPGFLYSPPEEPRTPERVIDYFARCIRLAGACGIPHATIDCGLGWRQPAAEFHARTWGAYGEIVACLRALCEVAAGCGVKLNVENTVPPACGGGFMSEAEQVVRLIEDVGAPNLGACLDSGHCTLAGGNPADFVRSLGPHLGETHFQDNYAPRLVNDAIGPADLHRPPGVGLIDWPAVMDALVDIGYDGPVVFELGVFWEADTLRSHAESACRNWRRLEDAWHMMRKRLEPPSGQGAGH